MKIIVYTITTIVIFISSTCKAQVVDDKINVILLGTFHYGATTDATKTVFPDLFSKKRQEELEKLTNQLAKLEIDKIFIERQEESQKKYDSLYKNYLSKKLTDTTLLRPEEVQIGFRLAEKLKLEKVYCVDVKQELPYDKIKDYELKHKDKEDAPFFLESKYPFNDKSQKLDLSKQTLLEYYLKMNNDYHKKHRLYDYFHYSMSYLEKDDFTGAEFTGMWYERNLKIFSKILNNLTAEDRTIFILFGSSHTDILEQFFNSNPHFNVIDLDEVISE